jgi:hypothetical protein
VNTRQVQLAKIDQQLDSEVYLPSTIRKRGQCGRRIMHLKHAFLDKTWVLPDIKKAN